MLAVRRIGTRLMTRRFSVTRSLSSRNNGAPGGRLPLADGSPLGAWGSEDSNLNLRLSFQEGRRARPCTPLLRVQLRPGPRWDRRLRWLPQSCGVVIAGHASDAIRSNHVSASPSPTGDLVSLSGTSPPLAGRVPCASAHRSGITRGLFLTRIAASVSPGRASWHRLRFSLSLARTTRDSTRSPETGLTKNQMSLPSLLPQPLDLRETLVFRGQPVSGLA